MARVHSLLYGALVAMLASSLWLHPVGFASLHDPLAKYLAMRHQMSDDQEGHRHMARWARAEGLTEQARSHMLRLLDFDPENENLRQALGHVNLDGRWLTHEEFEEMTAEVNRRTMLYHQWADPVGKVVKQLMSSRKSNQQRGREMLDAISEPGATYAIEQMVRVLPMPKADLGIEKLQGFEGNDATGALLRVAVYHSDALARQRATEALLGRETGDFIPELVEMLESPVISQFVVTRLGMGRLVHRHVFVQQRFDQDVVRQYDQMHLAIGPAPGDPNLSADAINQAMIANRQSAENSVRQTEQARQMHNLSIEQRNSRVMHVLRHISGEDAGTLPEDWWRWWYDQNDFEYVQRPQSFKAEILQPNVSTGGSRSIVTQGTGGESCDCFVAGTLVWTERGMLPIETLTTGDRVLSRDLKSNQLLYRNVIKPTRRQPTPTVVVRLPNETLQVSGGHPIHVVDQGWVRSRDLKPGDILTGTESGILVENVSPGSIEPLYNLVVERDANYYVGRTGVLSRDHTIPATRVAKRER